jgi:molybdate transport system ATP-binding protein
MIQARLRKQFPARRDSAAFSLDVELGTSSGITALFGPSGSGKTLTLDCVAGFVRPEEGRILLDDQILFDAQTRVNVPPRQRRCGYVFQNYALFPHMTLRRNLAFAAGMWPRIERHRRIGEMLEKFRLTDLAGRKPHELSGGQKQRCSIARALIGGPKVLLLDEPAAGLDIPLRNEFYEILRQVRTEFAIPMLLVTHSMEECFELADEMLILREGRVVQSGPPSKVCDRPATLDVARLLGIYNILPVEIRTLDPSRNTSVLRYGDFDIGGEYYPGRLRGDRIHIAVAPQQLKAVPKEGKPAAHQLPAQLLRVIEAPQAARLEFAGGLNVEMPRGEYERNKHVKEWAIEFPARSLRVL